MDDTGNDSDEYNLQLSLLTSFSPNYYESTKKIIINKELNLFHNELSNSAKKIITDSNKIISEAKKINDNIMSTDNTRYNIESLANNKLVIDILIYIFKYMPLRQLVRMRIACKTFSSIINFDEKFSTIYIDDLLIEKILPFNTINRNDLFNTLWNNIRTIIFKSPYTYETTFMGHPNNRINPPNLSEMIMEIEYPHQLNFLLKLNFNKVALILKCCSNLEKCQICQFNLIHEKIISIMDTVLRYRGYYCSIYHNNKLFSYVI
jgi:hypothetical protein